MAVSVLAMKFMFNFIYIFQTTLKFTGSEAQTIANCFKSKDFSVMQANGIGINRVKYQFLRAEEGRIVYGRCKGSGGIAIQKSKTG